MKIDERCMKTHVMPVLRLLPVALVAAGCSDSSPSAPQQPDPEPPPPTVAECSAADALSLSIGDAVTLVGANAALLCVSAGADRSEYVVVPFIASEALTATVALSIVGSGVTAAQGPPNPSLTPTQRGAAPPITGGPYNWTEWEDEFRRRERAEVNPLIPSARSAVRTVRRSLVLDVPSVGEELQLNVTGGCADEEIRTGTVRVVSQRAVVVTDTQNPSGGFTAADLQEIANTFDELVYPSGVRHFGAPTDLDDNDRVIIFYTSAVNELTPADSEGAVGGFFTSADLLPPEECAGSNFAEIVYMLAPDPEGEINDNPRSVEDVKRTTTSVVGHELQHLINASRRIYVNDAQSLEEVWLNEGLSHIAEELLFYEVTPFEPGQNLDIEAIRTSSQTVEATNAFQVNNLGRYRSYLARPDTTSLMGIGDELPTRGATWAFLRYASDRVPGSDGDFFFSLVNSTVAGLDNLAEVLPQPPLLWMQQWTLSVYADDAVPGTDEAFQQPSWDFRSVIPAIDPNDVFPLRVIPLGEDQTEAVTLRAGGAAFMRFAVEAGGIASISSSSGGAAPPSSVRLSVMRTR